jgi:hypothetical protein
LGTALGSLSLSQNFTSVRGEQVAGSKLVHYFFSFSIIFVRTQSHSPTLAAQTCLCEAKKAIYFKTWEKETPFPFSR